jgi:hypothetical protein
MKFTIKSISNFFAHKTRVDIDRYNKIHFISTISLAAFSSTTLAISDSINISNHTYTDPTQENARSRFYHVFDSNLRLFVCFFLRKIKSKTKQKQNESQKKKQRAHGAQTTTKTARTNPTFTFHMVRCRRRRRRVLNFLPYPYPTPVSIGIPTIITVFISSHRQSVYTKNWGERKSYYVHSLIGNVIVPDENKKKQKKSN